jgi:hypothetical protein
MAEYEDLQDYFCTRKILDNMTEHFQKLLKEVDELRQGCDRKDGKLPNLVTMYTLLHRANMICTSQFDFCASMMKETHKHEGVFAKLMEEHNST